MHRGPGEIWQPAGVVDVEVRDHDVAYVPGVEAEAPHLFDRQLLAQERRASEEQEAPPQGVEWLSQVVAAERGVDQHEAIRGLDQEAVTDQTRPARCAPGQAATDRAEAGAVEVMDFHRTPDSRAFAEVSRAGTAKPNSSSAREAPQGKARTGAPTLDYIYYSGIHLAHTVCSK